MNSLNDKSAALIKKVEGTAKICGPASDLEKMRAALFAAAEDFTKKTAADKNPESRVARMRAAKKKSDKRDYSGKHHIMRGLIIQYPDEFFIDSEDGDIVGITHRQSGFRMHLPRTEISDINLEKAAGISDYIPWARPEEGAETRNWRVWRAKWHLKRALKKLHEDPDVLVDSGLHRVAIPRSKFTDSELPYSGFKKSVMAVPERGQDSMLTWRSPKNNAHLHRHPEHWFMHRDNHPAMSIALQEAAGKPGVATVQKLKDLIQAAVRGGKHGIFEGVPGMLSYISNVITDAPTFEEIKDNPELAEQKSGSADVTLEVAGKGRLTVEIAEGREAEQRGLSGRSELPDDHGMLFKRAEGFWMKGVNFDLDIMFLDKQGSVVDIRTMKKPAGVFLPVYRPRSRRASLAVEAPAGWAAAHGINIGDKFTVT